MSAEPGTMMAIANLLPNGWTMQIDMQNCSAGVTLFGPFDDMYEPETGKGIEVDMVVAALFACFRDTDQERSVSGAWGRFVAEMGDNMDEAVANTVELMV